MEGIKMERDKIEGLIDKLEQEIKTYKAEIDSLKLEQCLSWLQDIIDDFKEESY